MQYLFEKSVLPFLQEKYPQNQIIFSTIIHTYGLGESRIDELISDLEKMNNPTIGLAAHASQVDIRVTAKANSESNARRLISPIINSLQEKLQGFIYGTDNTTFTEAIKILLKHKGVQLLIIPLQKKPVLVEQLQKDGFAQVLSSYKKNLDELKIQARNLANSHKCNAILFIKELDNKTTKKLQLLLFFKESQIKKEYLFAGNEMILIQWETNKILSFLYKTFLNIKE